MMLRSPPQMVISYRLIVYERSLCYIIARASVGVWRLCVCACVRARVCVFVCRLHSRWSEREYFCYVCSCMIEHKQIKSLLRTIKSLYLQDVNRRRCRWSVLSEILCSRYYCFCIESGLLLFTRVRGESADVATSKHLVVFIVDLFESLNKLIERVVIKTPYSTPPISTRIRPTPE